MTEAIIAVLSVVLGLGLGLWLGSRFGSGHAELARARSERAALEDRLRREADAAAAREARLQSEHERYVAQVRGDQDRLLAQFKALSADALAANQETFLRVAGERFARAQATGTEELARREQAMRQLVEPMREALEKVQRQTTETDKARAAGEAAMGEQVRQMIEASARLDRKTTDFINTLRRSDVRGNWGEVQLRRVVELAGMVQHVDFEEQESVRDAEGRNLRPDMTVRLAGGRTIVVDSKVALAALLEAFETEDESVRAERLQAHAKHVRRHVDDLAGKRYWDQFASAPEFVVMFVPSEAFYQSAVEQDPYLQEYAFGKRVVIATPTTLVAMLRTVAHAWKEDALAQNAQQVLSTGKELYDRLATMGGHLAKVGRAIESAGKAYNETVASLESRVLVSARRFGAMQHIDAPIDESRQVETDVRQLSAPELADDRAT
ncbi:DNA recombination protein RmuC [Demequina sp. NBRC 110053]|uniref:DNA recombination protein RmuC n=1 Tax=Demequina sp. NBRC 110053 TaxID=1570342 RepID=UPI000A01CE7C|nr:DNA recombination protein RmuC [Demequina sp. NBRC 110053]